MLLPGSALIEERQHILSTTQEPQNRYERHMDGDNTVGLTVNEGPTDGGVNGNARADLANTVQRVRLAVMLMRIFDLTLHAALLTTMQLQYQPTWGETCDRGLKVWTTTWLGASTLRALLHCLHSVWAYTSGGREGLQWLWKQPLVDLFLLAWFLYGIKPLFVDEGQYCNDASKYWALIGWSVQAFMYFVPCLTILLCIPILLCMLWSPWVRQRLLPLLLGPVEASTNQVPTPEEVLKKLKPITFRQAVEDDLVDAEVPPTAPEQQAGSPTVAPNDNVSHQLITSTLHNTFGTAYTSLLTRLNSAPEYTPTDIPASGSTLHHGQTHGQMPGSQRPPPPLERLPSMFKLTCPICVTEFAPDDEILRLPCVPRRHVFHTSCITEWLHKSQHCPMCRVNIPEKVAEMPDNFDSPV